MLKKISVVLVAAFIFVGCTTPTEDANNNTSSSSSVSSQSSSVSSDSANVGAGVSTSGITAAEVADHNTASDCWTIIDGKVYDLTSFIRNHDGGVAAISQVCGIDGTSLFQGESNHGSSADTQLESLLIGDLAS